MAYTTLREGSRGEEVKKMQQQLINQGYNVGSAGADGIYGKNTAAAVTQYQRDKGLSVDGIAGNQTQTSLYSAQAPQQNTAAGAPATTESPIKGVTQDVYNKLTEPYKQSENVANAWATIESLQQKLKGDTKYGEDLDKIVSDLMNHPAFQYDVEADPLFQQMLASQKEAGEKAMEDTVARSSALTGGYGNSWAQTAGQQAYDQYLQDAYNQLPQYYQLAMNAHNMETEDLMRKYSLLSEADQKEFDRLMTEYGLATDAYDRLYQQDRTGYEDRVGIAQQLAGMMSSDYWNNLQQEFAKEQFEYQKEQDRIANQRASARAYSSTVKEKSEDEKYDDLMDSYAKNIEAARKQYDDENFVNYLESIKTSEGFSDAEFHELLVAAKVPTNYLENYYQTRDSSDRDNAFAEAKALSASKAFANMTARQQQNAIQDFLNKYKYKSYYNDLYKTFYLK